MMSLLKPSPHRFFAAVLAFFLSLLTACGQPAPAVGPGVQDAPETHTNRLIHEKSPYLLQHAHNPVDWYPWGEEAFAKAKRENKPIFLSIGYSTCHWCHVMERESFEKSDVARLMNESFVSIKVDREERPDVDRVYMTFVQATTGSGGWPMSVWLTPDLKPFVGGTYFPPEDAYGRPGFKSLLRQLAEAWKTQEPKIRAQAGEVTTHLQTAAAGSNATAAAMPEAKLLRSAFAQIVSNYDEKEGGFGVAPKFPRPVTHNFLHVFAALEGVSSPDGSRALSMSAATLRHMADGGIHDHIGGGFHRYSVDRFWHIPHYEKMLYDQAQLVIAYMNAHRLTGDAVFADTVRDILTYVSRDMTDSKGGFYSAEDADSLASPDAAHKTEGAFYIWKKREIDALLGKDAPLFDTVYGVEADGNAPAGSDPRDELQGQNTLIRRLNDAAAAGQFGLTVAQVKEKLAVARQTLFAARALRARPHLDDKIVTAWNGLMISAYARAYQDFGNDTYLQSARRAAHFIQRELYDPATGVLRRSYRQGPADIDGFAADYSSLIQGLLDLYEADFDSNWLLWADALQTKQDELFWDARDGGYFASTGRDPSVLLRMKETYDGAEPSENSIAIRNLLRLSAVLDQPARHERAEQALRAFSVELERTPLGLPQMLVALSAAHGKPAQVVIAGQPGAPDTAALLAVARANARPNQVLLLADGGAGQKFLGGHAAFYQSVTPLDGKATAYFCENFVCQLPTSDPEELRALLRTTPPIGRSTDAPSASSSPIATPNK